MKRRGTAAPGRVAYPPVCTSCGSRLPGGPSSSDSFSLNSHDLGAGTVRMTTGVLIARHRLHGRTAIVAVLLGVAASPALAWTPTVLPDRFYDEPIVMELNRPTTFQFLPDGRLMFVEQRTGRLRMVVN